jgi:hypothetical protein
MPTTRADKTNLIAEERATARLEDVRLSTERLDSQRCNLMRYAKNKRNPVDVVMAELRIADDEDTVDTVVVAQKSRVVI